LFSFVGVIMSVRRLGGLSSGNRSGSKECHGLRARLMPVDDVFWHLVGLSNAFDGVIVTGVKVAFFRGRLLLERRVRTNARPNQFTECLGRHLCCAAARGGAGDAGSVSDSVLSHRHMA
jgi:hypothetical protein